MSEGIERAWERVTRWLREHAPASYETLRPPAEAGEIEACENEMGMALPGEYRRLLLVNDGAASFDGAGTCRRGAAFLPGGHRLLSAREAGSQTVGLREIMTDIDEENMTGYWWHPQWTLFARHIAADGLAIDQRPGPGLGAVGEFRHEDSTRFPLAPSLAAYFTTMANSLETGADLRHYRPTVKDAYLYWGVILPDRVVLPPHPPHGTRAVSGSGQPASCLNNLPGPGDACP